MKLDRKRWLILLAGILINLCQGAAYASSVFAKPMLIHLHCLVPKMILGADGVAVADPSGAMVPNMAKWAAAFSINLACLPIGMLLSGRFTDQRKGRLVIILGGVLFGSGMFLASYANSLSWLYLTFGAMMGLGSGAAYGAVVSTVVRWFPDKRGLASGLAVGALGFGSYLIPGIAIKLMAAAHSQRDAVLYAFEILGIAFLAIIATASFAMTPPPPDYKPAGYNPKSAAAKSQAKEDLDWTHMLARCKFWLLYGAYACGTFAGLMFVSQASPIAQSMAADIKALGTGPKMAEAACAVVMVYGLSNATGRVFWGFVSDRIGRIQAVMLMTMFSGVAMLLLPKLALDSTTLKMAAVVVGGCYGGCLGTFPSLCADTFGAKNLTANYGLLFSATVLPAISGPLIAAKISTATGSYSSAFIVAGVVSTAALVFALVEHAVAKKRLQASA